MLQTTIYILKSRWDFAQVRIHTFGSFNQYLYYLLNRYARQIQYYQKSENDKVTTTYQPSSRNFKTQKIQVQSTLWQLVNNYKNQIGFSSSYIIRILIEWDMQEQGEEVEPELELREETEIHNSYGITIQSHLLVIRIRFNENSIRWYGKWKLAPHPGQLE